MRLIASDPVSANLCCSSPRGNTPTHLVFIGDFEPNPFNDGKKEKKTNIKTVETQVDRVVRQRKARGSCNGGGQETGWLVARVVRSARVRCVGHSMVCRRPGGWQRARMGGVARGGAVPAALCR